MGWAVGCLCPSHDKTKNFKSLLIPNLNENFHVHNRLSPTHLHELFLQNKKKGYSKVELTQMTTLNLLILLLLSLPRFQSSLSLLLSPTMDNCNIIVIADNIENITTSHRFGKIIEFVNQTSTNGKNT
jgi:hypothetical protein